MNAITLSGLLLAFLTGTTLSVQAQVQAPRAAPAPTQGVPPAQAAPVQAPLPMQPHAPTQTPVPPQGPSPAAPPGDAPPDGATAPFTPGVSSSAPAPASPMGQAAPYQQQQPVVSAYWPPAQQPATQAPKVGVRLHDGFYLRMSVGMGPGQGQYKDTLPGFVPDNYKFTGLGAMFDVMVGGSPIPGWVLGGAFVGHTIIDPKVKLNNVDINTGNNQYTYSLSTFGLFTSIYPDPTAGLNFHALLGLSTLSVKAGDASVTPEPVGPSFMGGVGYDFWIADQWSMGPDFRIAYCKGTSKSDVVSHEGSLVMPTISFTATFH